jgi:hypothetical protein
MRVFLKKAKIAENVRLEYFGTSLKNDEEDEMMEL